MKHEQWQRVLARLILVRLTSRRWQLIHPPSVDMPKQNVCFNEDFVRRARDDKERAYDLIENFKELPAAWQRNLTGKTYKEWIAHYAKSPIITINESLKGEKSK